MKRFGVVLILLTLSLMLGFMPSPATGLELNVVEGKECKNVSIGENLPELDRLYVWDKSKNKLIHFRCVRNDVNFPDGGFASCGSKQDKKFIVPNKGPKCVWRKSIISKTKKPNYYGYNFNVGESCVDAAGEPIDSSLTYVKNRVLVRLDCRGGVWVDHSNSTQSSPRSTSRSSGNPSSGTSKNLENVCKTFADALISYGRTSRYATSQFEMQILTRKLTEASSPIQDLVRADKTLAPLGTSVGILLRHVQSQAPGGTGIPVNSDVLRMAVDNFNAFCGTSIYVNP